MDSNRLGQVGGLLTPALDPQVNINLAVPNTDATWVYPYGGGTANQALLPGHTGLWNARYTNWQNGFQQTIAPAVSENWTIYRAFDIYPLSGPDANWRDKTVVAQAYKMLESALPGDFLSLFGSRTWFGTEGKNKRAVDYEDLVQNLIVAQVEAIGSDNHEGDFYTRMIDALRYRRIAGHVFFKVFYRTNEQWVKTKTPMFGEDGKIRGWNDVSGQVPLYNGIDLHWLTLDSLAIDLGSRNRRWAIEKVKLSFQDLEETNRNYAKRYGRDLYQNLKQLEMGMASRLTQQEPFSEPGDTEGWPITEDATTKDPAENEVTLWLCWDNKRHTLTQIANNTVELCHGYAPTPDGLDPYISVPNVSIPGRPYGESDIHYFKDLVQLLTKFKRMRADETALNIWHQYVFRAGAITQDKYFFSPGGALEVELTDPSAPLNAAVMLLPTRPMLPEAYNESMESQQQAEAIMGVDAISQGMEASGKSRDVSAEEIKARVLAGSQRRQLNNIYLSLKFKKAFLTKTFRLLQQNLTQPFTIFDSTGKEKQVTLLDIQEPVDFVVGSGIYEKTQEERLADTAEWLAMLANPLLAAELKPRSILIDHSRNKGIRDPFRFIKTDEEKQIEQQQQMAAQMAMAQAQGGAPPGPGAGPVLPSLPPGPSEPVAEPSAESLDPAVEEF